MKVESIWCVCNLEGAPRVWLCSCTRWQKAFKSDKSFSYKTILAPCHLLYLVGQLLLQSFQLGWDHCLQLHRPLTQPGEAQDTSRASWDILGDCGDCVVPKNLVVLSCVYAQERFGTVPGTVLNGSEGFRTHTAKTRMMSCGGRWKSKESKRKERHLIKELGIMGGGWGPCWSDLNRLERSKFVAREKTKIDVEDQKLLTNKEEDCGILGPWNMFLNDYLMFVLLLNHTSLQAMVFYLEKLKVLTLIKRLNEISFCIFKLISCILNLKNMLYIKKWFDVVYLKTYYISY